MVTQSDVEMIRKKRLAKFGGMSTPASSSGEPNGKKDSNEESDSKNGSRTIEARSLNNELEQSVKDGSTDAEESQGVTTNGNQERKRRLSTSSLPGASTKRRRQYAPLPTALAAPTQASEKSVSKKSKQSGNANRTEDGPSCEDPASSEDSDDDPYNDLDIDEQQEVDLRTIMAVELWEEFQTQRYRRRQFHFGSDRWKLERVKNEEMSTNERLYVVLREHLVTNGR